MRHTISRPISALGTATGFAVTLVVALATGSAPAAAQSSCGTYDFAGPFAEAFLSGDPLAEAEQAAETITTMADGACHQDKVIAALQESLGGVAGYKAAATSEGAQKQVGLDGPVLGVLMAGMIEDDGATVAVDDGARMLFELDLIVRVGDAALAEATTREEALAGIDAVVPFIELGDLMIPKGAQITGPLLQAMNAGARLGVTGAPVPTDGMSVDDVLAISGTLSKDGAVVAEAPAAALLGHPLDALLWIVEATKARGMTLKEGDLLSLGGMGRFQLASPGVVEASYEGLGDGASVSVTLQ